MTVAEAKRAWEAACRAWSNDNLDQIEETMRLGEVMMFAATDLICAMEDTIAKANTLSDHDRPASQEQGGSDHA